MVSESFVPVAGRATANRPITTRYTFLDIEASCELFLA